MSTKDRILCALGFHGPMKQTEEVVQRRERNLPLTGDWLTVGIVLQCTICNRRVHSR